MTLDELLERGLRREPRALGRLLSRVEDGGVNAGAVLDRVYTLGGKATVIGLTGPPGAGKSTLTAALVTRYRQSDRRVAVVAVDPTSPFTGGALLGDRIRMLAHFEDPGVFIRSMATRGHLGGLAATTADLVDVLDAAGFDIVIVETIGVGQDDVEVASLVEICVLVLTPGLGDEIQALKSGIMEIGDIYTINKADLDGVDRLESALRSALSIQGLAIQGLEESRPIVRTVATAATGIDELVTTIADTRHRRGDDEVRSRALRRARQRVRALLESALRRGVENQIAESPGWDEECERVAQRTIAPHQVAHRLLEQAGLRPR